MYRLLFFITITLFLTGCSNIDNDMVRMEGKLEEYNKSVVDKVKAYELIKQKSEVVKLNYEQLIYMDYYNNIAIEGTLPKDNYEEDYSLHNITINNLTVHTDTSTVLQTIRINGIDTHMYIKIYWDGDSGEILKVVRRVNM